MAGHVHHIVGTAYDHEVTIGVLDGHIAGEITTGNSAPVAFVTLRVSIDRTEKVWERTFEYQQPTFPRLHGIPLEVHDISDNAREGFTHLPRSRIDTDRCAQARPSSFCLPPVISHIAPGPSPHQMLVRPAPGFRTQGLAATGEIPQAFYVVLWRSLRAVTHKHTHRCRGGKHSRHAVPLDDAPDHPRVGIIRGTFPKHCRRTGHKRRIHDIAVPDDPTNIRCTEKHILITDVPECLEVIVRPDHVTTMHVQHALGFPGGATSVENIERILSVHHLWGALNTLTLH